MHDITVINHTSFRYVEFCAWSNTLFIGGIVANAHPKGNGKFLAYTTITKPIVIYYVAKHCVLVRERR